MHFTNCVLNLAVFHQVNLKRSSFAECQFHEVEFELADLEGVKLCKSDFFKCSF